MTPSDLNSSLSPVSPTPAYERIQLIDILRGFALFGILIVNMYTFSHPLEEPLFSFDPNMSSLDQTTTWFILLLAEGKFYPIFSLLFGLGLTFQINRAIANNRNFIPFYLLRLSILLIIGLCHAYFIWVGDILTTYAVLGFLLIWYHKAQPRTLLIWVGIWLSISLLIYFGLILSFKSDQIQVAEPVIEEWEFSDTEETQIELLNPIIESEEKELTTLEQVYQIYSQGSFAEITAQRADEIHSTVIWVSIIGAPEILALFLLGIYFGKRQFFQNLDGNLTGFRQLFWWGFFLGMGGSLIYATWSATLEQFEPLPLALVVLVAQIIGSLALSLCYIAAITLLNHQPRWQPRLRFFAPVGQMALTNYLTQSLLCTSIFYGYGWGLFGQIGITQGVILALLIYIAQIILSIWWMRWFYFGPMEWLWRSLSYMKWQPFWRRQ